MSISTAGNSLAITTDGPIRQFVNTNINADIEKLVATLPADKAGRVILTFDQTGQGHFAVIAHKKDSHWTAVAAVNANLKGEVGAQAAVVFDW